MKNMFQVKETMFQREGVTINHCGFSPLALSITQLSNVQVLSILSIFHWIKSYFFWDSISLFSTYTHTQYTLPGYFLSS